jgi:hypothetical protein
VAVGNNLTVAGTSTLTGNVTSSGTLAMASSFKRNRIINGNMVVDQRNAGASVTPTASAYLIDRFATYITQSSKLSFQQNAGSVTAPVGYTKYLGATSLSAYSVSVSDYFAIAQNVEGLNAADFGWGTANAKTVTLSFVVYSSLTGTFGGAIQNSGGTRSYPFSYSVPVANTWTTITVTISGDTSGTWLTDNGIGLQIRWSLGTGSTYSGTAGAWAGTPYSSATGTVSVVGTSGATFYITGVQLEVGTKATPYEMQIYSDQLAQCQRYFQTSGVKPGTASGAGACAITFVGTTSSQGGTVSFSASMRAAPTFTVYDGAGTAGVQSYYNGSWNNGGSISNQTASTNYFYVQCNVSGSLQNNYNFSASSEL